MRKIGIATLALVAAVSAAVITPTVGQDTDAQATAGATAGGLTGGTIGFFVGGPLGAIIGGWAGAVIGADAAVSETSIRFAGENPVEPVYLDAAIDVGYRVNGELTIYPIEGDDQYGYFYANGRVWIVDMTTMEVVHSPGYVVRDEAVAYVQANPSASVQFSGTLAVGAEVGADLELVPVPGENQIMYVYVDDRPVLVDARSRMVIWIG
jgi:hypothetical protein